MELVRAVFTRDLAYCVGNLFYACACRICKPKRHLHCLCTHEFKFVCGCISLTSTCYRDCGRVVYRFFLRHGEMLTSCVGRRWEGESFYVRVGGQYVYSRAHTWCANDKVLVEPCLAKQSASDQRFGINVCGDVRSTRVAVAMCIVPLLIFALAHNFFVLWCFACHHALPL